MSKLSGRALSGAIFNWLPILAAGAYVAILIVAPLSALVGGVVEAGLKQALAALGQAEVLSAFKLTIQIGVVVVIIHAFFGTLLAWMLVRHRLPLERFIPFKALINGLLDMPFAVSAVVVGYMLLLLFGRSSVLGSALQEMGIRVAFAIPGMVLATLFVTLPFMVRELIPVLEAFDIRQEQAAATLGANGWQIFWRVTFPALRSAMLYGLGLTFARALGEFGAVLVIGGGVQGRTETATLYIYRALDERQYAGAYAAAIVLGLVSIILVIGLEQLRKRAR